MNNINKIKKLERELLETKKQFMKEKLSSLTDKIIREGFVLLDENPDDLLAFKRDRVEIYIYPEDNGVNVYNVEIIPLDKEGELIDDCAIDHYVDVDSEIDIDRFIFTLTNYRLPYKFIATTGHEIEFYSYDENAEYEDSRGTEYITRRVE